MVIPTNAGYAFNPASQNVVVSGISQPGITSQTVSVSGTDVGSADFTASAHSGSITMDAMVSADGRSASATIAAPAFSTAGKQ